MGECDVLKEQYKYFDLLFISFCLFVTILRINLSMIAFLVYESITAHTEMECSKSAPLLKKISQCYM